MINRVEVRKQDKDINDKKQRIIKVLEANHTDLKKKNKRNRMTSGFVDRKSIINSNLMTKLLKYIDKKVREKIISIRTIERFKRAQQNIESEY